MANKTRNYTIKWAWKEDGNRGTLETSEQSATTVQRAISKLVRELNDEDGAGDGAEDIRASDILVVDCRTDDR